ATGDRSQCSSRSGPFRPDSARAKSFVGRIHARDSAILSSNPSPDSMLQEHREWVSVHLLPGQRHRLKWGSPKRFGAATVLLASVTSRAFSSTSASVDAN